MPNVEHFLTIFIIGLNGISLQKSYEICLTSLLYVPSQPRPEQAPLLLSGYRVARQFPLQRKFFAVQTKPKSWKTSRQTRYTLAR
jgi:hypothetical protein